jgi:hypothetical protein
VPLVFPEPPSNFVGFFREHLSRLATHYASHSLEHPLAEPFSPGGTEMPHEIFTLSLLVLRRQADVSSASPQGWRLFLRQAPPIRVAEVDRSPNDNSLIFLGITAGPQVDYTRQLLEKFKADRELDAIYTVRLLRVQPLYLNCVWLSTGRSHEDFFLPVPPVFSPFSLGSRYRRDDMAQLLTTAALQKSPNTKVLFGE